MGSSISRRSVSPWILIVVMCSVLEVGTTTTEVHAAGTVTNCSTYGSTETVGDLAWALQGGGLVTFLCSGEISLQEISANALGAPEVAREDAPANQGTGRAAG